MRIFLFGFIIGAIIGVMGGCRGNNQRGFPDILSRQGQAILDHSAGLIGDMRSGSSECGEVVDAPKPAVTLYNAMSTVAVNPTDAYYAAGLLDSLGEESCRFFIERYQNEQARGRFDRVALSLAFYAGGEGLAEFLITQMSASGLGNEAARDLCLAVAGLAVDTCSPSHLVWGEGLREVSERLRHSTNSWERSAAMGLLAHCESEDSLLIVRQALVGDPNAGVRAAAAISLGKRGGVEMVEYLNDRCNEVLKAAMSSEDRQIEFNGLQRALITLKGRHWPEQ